MKILDAPQGSAAWLEARAGLITASRLKDVMAVLKNGGESESRNKYKWQLAGERISGFAATSYVSPAMEHGTEYESIARAEYEIATGRIVDQVGMVYHPTIPNFAASPDGLIDSDGATEFKCPQLENHLRWVIQGGVPAQHQLQCLGVMMCCERDWIDFGSFHPSLPDGLRLYLVEMVADEERIGQIAAEVRKFDAEVSALVAELRQRVKPAPPVEPAPDIGDWAAQFDSFIAGEVTP
jgi:putative phage-type endonuclease